MQFVCGMVQPEPRRGEQASHMSLNANPAYMLVMAAGCMLLLPPCKLLSLCQLALQVLRVITFQCCHLGTLMSDSEDVCKAAVLVATAGMSP